jgi:hypothetical protein
MDLILAWLVFPLLLAVSSLGAGLLVERLSGTRLPGVLIVPSGLALIVVIGELATYRDATAELATPAVLIAAVFGLVSSASQVRGTRLDLWAIGLVLVVFGVFGAPVVLSGEATFAGYTQLGDTAIHFVLIDHLMEHGRDLSGLPPSSYAAALDTYLGTAYPTGAQTALGAVRPLVGQDVAWVFQPYIVFLATVAALAIYSIARSLVRWRVAAAVAAAIAAQAALVYGFSLQGSVKEIATVWVIALAVALVPVSVRAKSVRGMIPLAISLAAGMAVLRLALAPWLGLVGLACLGAVVWTSGRPALRAALRRCVALLVLAAALSFPTLALTGRFVHTTTSVGTDPTEKGNLVNSLDPLQVLGIWPSRDFRFDPHYPTVTYLLLAAAAVAVAVGLCWIVRRRAALPLLYLTVSIVGSAYVISRGSPWVDAKALMIASPAVVLVGMLGAASLLDSRGTIAAALLAAPIAVGVLFTNAVAYHYVPLAPRDRLHELHQMGERLEGDGPLLYTEFEEFAKHYLRAASPTGWSEPWRPTSEGGQFALSYDVDELPLDYVVDYPTLVLRRSPTVSRPPSTYDRTFAGAYYEVWRRPRRPRQAVQYHGPAGQGLESSAALPCNAIGRLARQARRSQGRLAYVARPSSFALLPPDHPRPVSSRPDRQASSALVPSGDGQAEGTIRVSFAGRYEIWLGGSFGRGFDVLVDGREVGTVSYKLNPEGQFARAASVALGAGEHRLRLRHASIRLHPGYASGERELVPVLLTPETAFDRRVRYERAASFESLCDRELDWVEIVGRHR